MIGALLGAPVLRYIIYPLTRRSDDAAWTEAGPVADVPAYRKPLRRVLDIERRDGWRETASQPTVFLVRQGKALTALSAICPHLGCAVHWDDAKNIFVCPCHGGEFSADGARLSGPPPRAMDALDTRVSGGTLMVKYQYFRPDVPNKQVTG